MDREQWRAVWRLMRIEKRMLRELYAAEMAKLRERTFITDEYELRFVSYGLLIPGAPAPIVRVSLDNA